MLVHELPEGFHAGTPLSFSMLFHARWADAVFFKVTVFWLGESNRLQIESGMDATLASLCDIYSAWFALKAEDDSVFIGLSVSDVNGKIAWQQDFRKKRCVLVWLVCTSQQ